MDVYEAVTSRRAVRGFTDEPVLREVLERVLSAAAWSPSGSNLQPWNSYVLTGALLAELKTRAEDALQWPSEMRDMPRTRRSQGSDHNPTEKAFPRLRP
jgi:nitroreductase